LQFALEARQKVRQLTRYKLKQCWMDALPRARLSFFDASAIHGAWAYWSLNYRNL
jgi:hypothetical protein